MTLDEELILIAAVGKNNALGVEGRLPWHIPEDFQYFRQQTMNHPVIIGRITHESLPKALDGRQEIVITRNKSYNKRNVLTASSPEDATTLLLNPNKRKADIDYSKIYVAGGGKVYNAFIPFADKLLITQTRIKVLKPDAYFPEIKEDEWRLAHTDTRAKCTFETYLRK